jgi:hypothetical protein
VEGNMRMWEENIDLNLKEKIFVFALNSIAKKKGQ